MSHQWNNNSPHPVVFTTNNTNSQPYTETMRLDASGNLGIGGSGKQGQITLHDGIETATLTIEMLKALKKFTDFVEYAKKADKDIGELWTAYEVATKLEKSNEPNNN